jgi:hypothetical protein
MERSLDSIKETIKNCREGLREKYGVERIGLFGSYVRGERQEGSDLDILIEFRPDVKMDLIKFVELESYLSDLLGMDVELVMKSALKPRIGRQILKEVVYI